MTKNLSARVVVAGNKRRSICTTPFVEFPGAVAIPLRSTQLLMDAPLMGDTIASNFRRASPSKWMENLFGSSREEVESQVNAIIAGAVWAITADLTLRTLPQAEQWQWFTERDALVCELCRPLHGMTMSREEMELLWPRHPGCRCSTLPIDGGRAP